MNRRLIVNVGVISLTLSSLAYAVPDACDAFGEIIGINAFESGERLIFGTSASDFLGRQVATGDFNGDGDEDLLVSAPGSDLNGSLSGSVYFFAGPLTAGANLNANLATAVFTGPSSADKAGWSIANAGDIDGDTIDDILIGAVDADGAVAAAGAAYLVRGDAGLAGLYNLATDADATFGGIANDDDFGAAVAGIGDVNQDGSNDIIIGATGADVTGANSGAAYIFFGPLAGIYSAANADVRLAGPNAESNFGGALVGGADYTGDGVDDFVVGANKADDGGTSSGAAYLYRGGLGIPPVQAVADSESAMFGEGYTRSGWALSNAGDVDLDGYADLWVTAQQGGGNKKGAVYLVLGSDIQENFDLTSDSRLTITGENANDLAGSSVVGNVDFDGDGVLDVLIGGERADGAVASSGAAWVVHGPFTTDINVGNPPAGTRVGKIGGRQLGDFAGFAVAAGDINGDGFADAVVGAYSARRSTAGLSKQGTVATYFGGADVADEVTWYRDVDGDGWGGATTQVACTAPLGYVAYGNDCNDGDTAFHPYANDICGNPNDYNCDGMTNGLDNDGDGYTSCQDCDDRTVDISPADAEVCGDNADNNCDGQIDDATAADALPWCPDVDGDGFGDDSLCVVACADPGYFLTVVVNTDGDCDDLDDARSPAALERCDFVDNNCDGLTDDATAVDASVFYADADSDGYGDFGNASVGCSAPAGYVDDQSDCDDANVNIKPGVAEICDYADNDCDGMLYVGGPVLVDEARVTMEGGTSGDLVGAHVAFLDDLNGDGFDEFAVGAPFNSDLGPESGALYIVRGNEHGGVKDLATTRPDGTAWWDIRFRSNRSNSFVGSVVRSGDINGDGETDIIIGAYGSRAPNINQGAVYVKFGPILDGDYVVETDSDFVAKGNAADEQAGYAIAVADLDGDGKDDIVASAPQAAGTLSTQGEVYVIYGTPAMAGQDVRFSAANAVFTGVDSGDQIGSAVGTADLDGDGRLDIVIGAQRQGALDQGAVIVHYGPGGRWAGAVAGGVVISGDTGSDRIGLSLDAGYDVNNDGYDDLLVGGFTNSAYLVWGGATRLTSATMANTMAYRFAGLTGQRAGNSVAFVGDANGDGFDDFIVSAHRDDESASDGGAAYLVYGSDTWYAQVDTNADDIILMDNIESFGRSPTNTFPTYSAANRTWLEGAKIMGNEDGTQLGEAVAGGGDFNGDGSPDIALGAPSYQKAGMVDSGLAVLYATGVYGYDNNDVVPAGGQTDYYWDFDADTFLDENGTQFTSCPMHAPISFRDPLNPVLRGKPVAETIVPDELTDCLDTDHLAYPGANEVNNDGIDRDCDGFDNTNRPPTISITLTPSTLYTTTPAVVNGTPSDPDGDVVDVLYSWYVDGVEVGGQTTNTLAPSFFDKNQTVEARVMLDDGRDVVGPFTRSKVVQNSDPTLTACNVAPAAGDVRTDFNVVGVGLFDEDGADAGLTGIRYQWRMCSGPVCVPIDGETSTTLQSCSERNAPGYQFNCARGSRLRADCVPFDPDGDGETYQSAIITITNAQPTVTQCLISPTSPDTTVNLTVSGSGSDPDAQVVQLSYEWLVDGVVDPLVTGTTYPAASTEHFEVIQARCTGFDGEAYSDPVLSTPVTILNTPPTAPSVDLTPNLPRSDQSLTVTVVTAATDIDGDPIDYDYYWTQNGSPYANPTYPSNATTVVAAATVRGDTWEVTVEANDGFQAGGTDSDFVSIGNTPPTFTGASLAPTAPTTVDDVTVSGTAWFDNDADPENYNVSFYVNGTIQSPQAPNPRVLADTNFVRGDEIYATLQAVDPFTTGPTHTTSTITVVNAIPSTPVVAITPNPPGENDNLTCNLTTPSTDPDPDTITYTYAWYKDGVLQPALTTNTVGSANTAFGQIWYCTVTPSDGIVSGDTATSPTVTIQDLNAPPAPTINSISRYTNGTSLTLAGTCDSGPLDCNSITLTCVDGNSTDVYSGVACTADAWSQLTTFERGQTTNCTAKCFDSTLNESVASNVATSESCNPYDQYEDATTYGDVGTSPYDEWATLPDTNTVSHTINANIVEGDSRDWYIFRTTDNPTADAAANVNNYKFEIEMSVGDADYNLWVRRGTSTATAECISTGPYDDYTEDVYDRADAPNHAAPGNRNSCAANGGANWNLYNLCENFGKSYYVEVLREFDTDCQHYQLRVYNGRP